MSAEFPRRRIFVSAQLRDQARFEKLVDSGIRAFVDVAGDRPHMWRPEEDMAESRGLAYTRIGGVEDTNVDLPDAAFGAVAAALDAAEEAGHSALLFSARQA